MDVLEGSVFALADVFNPELDVGDAGTVEVLGDAVADVHRLSGCQVVEVLAQIISSI